MRVLLITPPMTQINAPGAAGPQLAGFLRLHGHAVSQADLSLELFLHIFSRAGLRRIRRAMRNRRQPAVAFFLRHFDHYADAVDPVVRFLQDRDPTLAHRITMRVWLPEGPSFQPVRDLGASLLAKVFGRMGIQDWARYLASLFIDDIALAIREGADPDFGLARYAERLAAQAPCFTDIRQRLEGPPTPIRQMLDELTDRLIAERRPQFVGLSVAFPGQLLGALAIARRIRQQHPRLPLALGGGYINTELRELSDPSIFDYVDAITLDDGEVPLLRLIEHRRGRGQQARLFRTLIRHNGRVLYVNDSTTRTVPFSRIGAPHYAGLKLNDYVSLCEMPNPLHRLWSSGRWNKLMLAHGCYWHQCAFCDTRLDYIRRFDPANVPTILRRIRATVLATGQSGFHFVDEAAPPALLDRLSAALLHDQTTITWWTNVRLERQFTPELTRRLATAGCVAVTAGLETAQDRLLRLMNKGITLAAACRTIRAFAQAGIMVHLYLMYGFPTQSAQEIVDGLEVVRRLFLAGWIQSAYWHRFALTIHSPMAMRPERFGIQPATPTNGPIFAHNELRYASRGAPDYRAFGPGLKKAVYNYMLGLGLEDDVTAWFDFPVPEPRAIRLPPQLPAS